MKVCLISTQILSSTKVGGFGSMTKQLALALANQGIEVIILAVGTQCQDDEMEKAGISLVRWGAFSFLRKSTFRRINADIYHSQNPSMISALAKLAAPSKRHLVTCRDPRGFKDWWLEFKDATWLRRMKIPISWFFEEGVLSHWMIKKADLVGCPALFLIPKSRKLYGLDKDPVFLPNLEKIPRRIPAKSSTPVVCFVGRLEKRKRPELYLQLAAQFPQVEFNIIGKSEEPARNRRLHDYANRLKNVKWLGYVDKFKAQDFYAIYDKSWIMVNTSSREGLPLTFIEAAGRGCAILSSVNPDNFSSEFGYWAAEDDFVEGLDFLLQHDNWRKKGEAGRDYVIGKYSFEESLKAHLTIYRQLLGHEQDARSGPNLN